MGHHADQARPKSGGEFQQQIALGMHAATRLAAVDFDQCARRRRVGADNVSHRRIVSYHDNLSAGLVKLADLLQLLRGDADRVQDVGDAVAKKMALIVFPVDTG
jgi:hypothetical protein